CMGGVCTRVCVCVSRQLFDLQKGMQATQRRCLFRSIRRVVAPPSPMGSLLDICREVCVCVCLCLCLCLHMCMCVYVCVCERERESERKQIEGGAVQLL